MKEILQKQVQDVDLSKEEKDILLTVLGEKYGAIEEMEQKTRSNIIQMNGVMKTNYLIGVYNGLEMAKSIITGKEPNFFDENITIKGGRNNG